MASEVKPATPDPDDSEVVDGVVDPRPARYSRSRLDAKLEQSRYVSPLPSPEDLERYRKLLPDAPERLLAAGEREAAHRHQIENRLAAIDEKSMPNFYEGQRRGQLIGLAVAVFIGTLYFGVMTVAILKGYQGGVGGAALFGIAAIVWAIRRDASGGAQSDSTPAPETNDERPPS